MDFNQEFAHDPGKFNRDVWMKSFNKRFIMILWVQDGASCKPSQGGLDINSYKSYEMTIYRWRPCASDPNYMFEPDVWASFTNDDLINLIGSDLYGFKFNGGPTHAEFVPKFIIDGIVVALDRLGPDNGSTVVAHQPVKNNIIVAKEKPCKNCGRQNDIGISTCWWCSVAKPTE
jgi:hypothetical protein